MIYKHIIMIVTWSGVLYYVEWISSYHHTRRGASRVIRSYGLIQETWYCMPDQVTIIIMCFIYLFLIWATAWDFQQFDILTSVDSDEPVQLPYKLRNLKWGSVSSLTVIEFLAPSKGSDQSARMRRLVKAFAGRAYQIVGNFMHWLIS